MDEDEANSRALLAQIFGAIDAQRWMLANLMARDLLQAPDPLSALAAAEADILRPREAEGVPLPDSAMAYAVLQESEAQLDRLLRTIRKRVEDALARRA